MSSFVGSMTIADLGKTTLGPKGMDKLLQSTGRGHIVTVAAGNYIWVPLFEPNKLRTSKASESAIQKSFVFLI